ncbi:MAG: hypothetical protein Q8S17_13650, partial [Humidesulfovibrio sp.]|nr:hypothetical protein [Humidesulfovibrio sp.]
GTAFSIVLGFFGVVWDIKNWSKRDAAATIVDDDEASSMHLDADGYCFDDRWSATGGFVIPDYITDIMYSYRPGNIYYDDGESDYTPSSDTETMSSLDSCTSFDDGLCSFDSD